jgi:hypothetical protein
MLYDKRWDQQTKADPFLLESLIAWLEKQPVRKRYCYLDHGRCLLGQYFAAHGFNDVHVIGRYHPHGAHFIAREGTHAYPGEWDNLASAFPRTFGGALKRARWLAR